MSKSFEFFSIAQASSEKFDYFVCGVSSALFAYIAQTYAPRQLELGVSALEPLALLFLAISFFVGLKRIETANLCRSANHQIVEVAEKMAIVADVLSRTPAGQMFDLNEYRHMDRTEVERRHQRLADERKEGQSKLPALHAKSYHLYNWRNRLLLLGFVFIFLAKVLQPYQQIPQVR